MRATPSRSFRIIALGALLFLVACQSGDPVATDTTAHPDPGPLPGGGLNCNGDKGVDQPIQIQSADVESDMRIHLVAGGGYDNTNGVVNPNWYEITDQAGNLSYVPQGLYVGDPTDLLDLRVQGFRPGGRYTIRLMSQDLCGNTAYSAPAVVTLPRHRLEANVPMVYDPRVETRSVFVATIRVVVVEAEDDTGLKSIEYSFDGVVRNEQLVGGQLVWWLAGDRPSYEWIVPDDLRGQTGMLTIRVFDIYDNVTRVTKRVTL